MCHNRKRVNAAPVQAQPELCVTHLGPFLTKQESPLIDKEKTASQKKKFF